MDYGLFKCYQACEAARADDFDPKGLHSMSKQTEVSELICGACVDPSKKTTCTVHGTEYMYVVWILLLILSSEYKWYV